jgi:hypothetical protein
MAEMEVLSKNVVGRFRPFQVTTDASVNPLPIKNKVVSPVPTGTEVGKTKETCGAGFGPMVRLNDAEVPPPGWGFTTAMFATFGDTSRSGVTIAVS